MHDLLSRFRPSGAPGAATPAGVPADRRAAVDAELEPVFAELLGPLGQAEEVRRSAQAAADARTQQATAQADSIVAEAMLRASTVRADEVDLARARANLADIAAAEQATAEADAVRRQAQRRRPTLVAAVVDRVRAALDGPAGAGP